eukprot:261183_1
MYLYESPEIGQHYFAKTSGTCDYISKTSIRHLPATENLQIPKYLNIYRRFRHIRQGHIPNHYSVQAPSESEICHDSSKHTEKARESKVSASLTESNQFPGHETDRPNFGVV